MIATAIIPVFMAILAGLVLPVQSHGVMNNPQPYHLHTEPLLQVDPLNATKYPFPCHGPVGAAEHVTPVVAGEPVFVNFTIGAEHHGGSCQFSVTYKDPDSHDFNLKSNWKTIFTIIGGCPAESRYDLSVGFDKGPFGVLPTDQNRRYSAPSCHNDTGINCIRQFNIPFPKDMPNGNATFAWTWFNYVGNREMYM